MDGSLWALQDFGEVLCAVPAGGPAAAVAGNVPACLQGGLSKSLGRKGERELGIMRLIKKINCVSSTQWGCKT